MKAVIAILLAVVAIAAGTQYVQTYGTQYGSQYYYPQTYSGYQYVQQPLKYVQQPYVAASSAVVQQTVPVTYASQYAVPSYTYGSYGYPYYNYGSYGLLKK